MLMATKKNFGKTLEFGNDFPDGRLTEVSDRKKYEWKKMIDVVRSLGRPLTEKESEQFGIKDDWNAIQETLYLNSIERMVESITSGGDTHNEDCIPENMVKW